MFVAFFVHVAFGLLFSLCARDRVRGDGPFATPAFPLVAMFAGLVVAPVAVYLFSAHPAWTMHYLADPARVPSLMVVPFAVVFAGTVVGSWYAGSLLLRAEKTRLVIYAAAGAAAAALLAVFLLSTRLGRSGSYVEFREGRAQPLLDVKLGYVLVTVAVSTVAAALYVALELMRDARRVRTR